MASHAAVSAQHATLAALTVDDVTLSSGSIRLLRIQNRSAADTIFYTWGGRVTPSDPTVNGDDCFCLPPGAVDELDVTHERFTSGAVVKLISSGIPSYSVEAFSRT